MMDQPVALAEQQVDRIALLFVPVPGDGGLVRGSHHLAFDLACFHSRLLVVWFDVLPYDPSRRTPGNCIYAWRLANHARINKFGHGIVIASLVHVPDEHRMRHTNRAVVLMAGAAPCRISLNRIRSAAQVSPILTRALSSAWLSPGSSVMNSRCNSDTPLSLPSSRSRGPIADR